MREEKDFTRSTNFLRAMTKGQEVYSLAIFELCAQLDMKGYEDFQKVINRISRGYTQLINTMMKYCLKQFHEKSNELEDSEATKSINKPLANEELAKKLEESIANRTFYSQFHQIDRPTTASNLDLEHGQQRQSTKFFQGHSAELPQATNAMTVADINFSSLPQSRHLSPSRPPMDQKDQSRPKTQADERHDSHKISFYLPEKPDLPIGNSIQNTILDEALAEEEQKIMKEYAEIMKERRMIGLMEPSGTSFYLQQVLKRMAAVQRRTSSLFAEERRNAKYFVPYKKVPEKSQTENSQQVANANRMLAEAEKLAQQVEKELEYKKIIEGLREENEQLKNSVAELKNSLNDTKEELLKLQAAEATMNLEMIKLQNEIRTLRCDNLSIRELLEEQKLKLQESQELLESQANADKAISAEASLKLSITVMDLRNQISGLKDLNLQQEIRIKELEKEIQAKNQANQQSNHEQSDTEQKTESVQRNESQNDHEREHEALLKNLSENVGELRNQKKELEAMVEEQRNQMSAQLDHIEELRKEADRLRRMIESREDKRTLEIKSSTAADSYNCTAISDDEVPKKAQQQQVQEFIPRRGSTQGATVQQLESATTQLVQKVPQPIGFQRKLTRNTTAGNTQPFRKPIQTVLQLTIGDDNEDEAVGMRKQTKSLPANKMIKGAMAKIIEQQSTHPLVPVTSGNDWLGSAFNQSNARPVTKSFGSRHLSTTVMSNLSFETDIDRQGSRANHRQRAMAKQFSPFRSTEFRIRANANDHFMQSYDDLMSMNFNYQSKNSSIVLSPNQKFVSSTDTLFSNGTIDLQRHEDTVEAQIQEEQTINEMYDALKVTMASDPRVVRFFKSFSQLQSISMSFQQEPSTNTSLIIKEKREDSIEKPAPVSFQEFRDYYLKFKQIHQKCGAKCTHMRRLYNKIGWYPPGLTRPNFLGQKLHANNSMQPWSSQTLTTLKYQ